MICKLTYHSIEWQDLGSRKETTYWIEGGRASYSAWVITDVLTGFILRSAVSEVITGW